MDHQPVSGMSDGDQSLGQLISRERQRRSLTRKEFAAMIRRVDRSLGTNERTVKRWESGDVPQPASMRALATAMGQPVDRLVALARRSGAQRPYDGLGGQQAPWAEPADADYVAGVRATVQRLVGLEIAHGGTEIADLRARCFRSVRQRLAAGAAPAVTRDLQAAAAEMAEVAGWLLHDADRQDAARQMNNEGLFLARLTGDRSMELFILANASLVALFTHQPGEALMIANAALDSGDLTARERVIFRTRQARALAQLGDGRAALRNMDEAQSTFWDGASSSDPAWAWWVDAAEVRAHIALAHGDLGEAGKSADLLQRSVEDCPPRRLGARFIYLAQQLRASIEAEAWSDAEAVIAQSVPYIGEVHSERTRALLSRAVAEMHSRPAPGRLLEAGRHLRDLLAATAE
jgi:transcriptional regulator with XRE-family HTH domain